MMQHYDIYPDSNTPAAHNVFASNVADVGNTVFLKFIVSKFHLLFKIHNLRCDF